MNWKLRKAFTGNNTSDVQTINGYIAAGEDNDFSVEVSPVGKEYPAPLVVPRTNLVDYSEDFSVTSWAGSSPTRNITITQVSETTPDGGSVAYKIQGTSIDNQIGHLITIAVGDVITNSIYVKRVSGTGDVKLRDVNNGFTDFSLDVADGWKRINITTTATSTSGRFYLNLTTYTDEILVWGAQQEAGNKATEYIPTNGAAVTRSWDSFSRVQNQVPGICNGIHTHTGAASGGGIAATTLTGTGSGGKFKYEFDTLGKLTLIEAMTHENLLLQSNTFSTTWTTGGTLADEQAGYDGTNDAWLYTKGSQFDGVQQSTSVNGVNTLSVYAKSGTVDFFMIRLTIDSGTYVPQFDLSDGDVIVNAGLTCTTTDVGSGWWRCIVTFDGNLTAISFRADTFQTSGSIYIQDAQLESGSQATGYIETTTAPVREGAGQGYKVDDKLSITTNEGHDIEFRLVEGSNATTVTVGMEATKPSKPVPFPVTKMRVADSTDRRVLIMDQRSRYVFPKPTPYLLDTYEGATAAYSLRRLRSAYTGPAVRVRRASNNDELDIYFDGQGNLDTASLEAFCAGTDGFVKVWYDQGPGGNDAEQTTTANQPKIYDSVNGVIQEGSAGYEKPAIEVDFGHYFQMQSSVSPQFITMCLELSASSAVAYLGLSGLSSNVLGSHNGAYVRYRSNSINYDFTQNLDLGQSILTVQDVALDVGVYANSVGSASNDITIADRISIDLLFRRDDAGWSFIGNAQEIILYENNQSANRTGIETNINDYYNIY